MMDLEDHGPTSRGWQMPDLENDGLNSSIKFYIQIFSRYC